MGSAKQMRDLKKNKDSEKKEMFVLHRARGGNISFNKKNRLDAKKKHFSQRKHKENMEIKKQNWISKRNVFHRNPMGNNDFKENSNVGFSDKILLVFMED